MFVVGYCCRLYFNGFYTFYFAYFCIICFIYGTWELINGLAPVPCPSYQRVDVISSMQIIHIFFVGAGAKVDRLIDGPLLA